MTRPAPPGLSALIPKVLELVWRRRLVAEAQRRMVRAGTEGGSPVCVGFADLVGFTAQTQQLDTATLAEVVGRFEAIAYDVVAAHGGRVVKTIGDEVMFVNDDVVAGSGRRSSWPGATGRTRPSPTSAWAWPSVRCSSATVTSSAAR